MECNTLTCRRKCRTISEEFLNPLECILGYSFLYVVSISADSVRRSFRGRDVDRTETKSKSIRSARSSERQRTTERRNANGETKLRVVYGGRGAFSGLRDHAEG